MTQLLQGQADPIWLRYLNNGVPRTGATVVVKVTRTSDVPSNPGWVLDWGTMSFGAPGAQPTARLTESGSDPGLYGSVALDTGVITNATAPDTYLVTYLETAPAPRTIGSAAVHVRAADGLAQILAAIKGVGWSSSETLHGLRQAVASVPVAVASLDVSGAADPRTLGGAITRLRKWLTWTASTPTKKVLDLAAQRLKVYDDDGTTVLDQPPLHDVAGGAVAPAQGEPAQIG